MTYLGVLHVLVRVFCYVHLPPSLLTEKKINSLQKNRNHDSSWSNQTSLSLGSLTGSSPSWWYYSSISLSVSTLLMKWMLFIKQELWRQLNSLLLVLIPRCEVKERSENNSKKHLNMLIRLNTGPLGRTCDTRTKLVTMKTRRVRDYVRHRRLLVSCRKFHT